MTKKRRAFDDSFKLQVVKMINDQLKEAGLLADLKRCTNVEGIGFLTGARLIATFQRGDFKNADAFIAFLGMDLRVSQSGQKDGRRRLLHNAAISASRTPAWKSFYEEQRNRGFSTTQALVILARKLARVVFALLKGQSEYQPKGG
jgi:transposase